MKLLYFTDRDLRHRNAEAVHVLEVVRSLATQGHEIGLMSPVAVQPPHGAHLFIYGREDPEKGGMRRLMQQLIHAPLTAARKMRAGNYDGMYVRLSIPLLLTSTLLRRACRNRPLIFEVNGILRSELSMRRRLMYAPILPFEGLLLRRANAIVAASEEIRIDLLMRHRLPNVIAVPNGVNPDVFRPQERTEARRQLRLNESIPVIGFVGNFAPWHGVEVLLKAMSTIRDRYPEARIMLVGGGVHRHAIEAEISRLGISDAVDLVGTVPHEQIPTYINAFTCCVSPAIPLGDADPGRNSLKVFEYLACGVPVVLSDLPGVASLVKEYHFGVAVKPDDPGALATAIVEVLSYDKATRDRICREARAAVITDYSWDANAAQVAELFQNHLTREPSISSNGLCRSVVNEKNGAGVEDS
jgi:glycosyltransferase involved in cell wall biosynthesis